MTIYCITVYHLTLYFILPCPSVSLMLLPASELRLLDEAAGLPGVETDCARLGLQ